MKLVIHGIDDKSIDFFIFHNDICKELNVSTDNFDFSIAKKLLNFYSERSGLIGK